MCRAAICCTMFTHSNVAGFFTVIVRVFEFVSFEVHIQNEYKIVLCVITRENINERNTIFCAYRVFQLNKGMMTISTN